jgi:hypothetical protein
MDVRHVNRVAMLVIAVVGVMLAAIPAAAASPGTDTMVTIGSQPNPFPQNKQNEPAVAVDPVDPSILIAGANEEIDNLPGMGTDTSFTPGVGGSGVYFSFDGGLSWTQPTYTGWSGRSGTVGIGPIGTLPWYYENGLVSDGDPIVAFGPVPKNGAFSWDNGVRAYYANLTSNFPSARSEAAFRGYEAIAVSRFDDPTPTRIADQANWKPPVIVSTRTSSTTFSDKESLWADNAATSPYFGNVYASWVSFRSLGGAPEPVMFSRSTNGGRTWSAPKQITSAADSPGNPGRQGVMVRTGSKGGVYLVWEGYSVQLKSSVQYVARSTDGGMTFGKPRVAAVVSDVGQFDPASGDYTFDGLGGARTDSFPSVDIANGAPSGENASNAIVISWSDAASGLGNEKALVTLSTDRGATWSAPVDAAEAGDRPDFPGIAISPDGADVYVTYDAFLTGWQETLADPRPMLGVVRHADLNGGTLGSWTTLHRGAVGDARAASANNLTGEFIGDYTWTAATNDNVVSVWNDVRNAAIDQAVLDYRASLATATPLPKPVVTVPTFGNTDIFGITLPDPTP